MSPPVGGNAEGVERDGGQRDGFLFAGGEQHVHLALARRGRDRLGAGDELVGHAAARGNDDDDLVPLRPVAFDLRGDVFDAVNISDGSSAVFLNYQHFSKNVGDIKKLRGAEFKP